MQDITDYDYILISSSGGKDSEAMLAYVVELCDAVSFPRERIVVAHADLGRAEWEGTTELVKKQADHYGLRLEIVQKGGATTDLLEYVLDRHEKNPDTPSWPSNGCRFCTSDFKRGPISKVLTQLAKEGREAGIEGQVKILQCMGLRAGESVTRSKLEPFTNDKRNTNGRRLVDIWLPIHDWTVDEVWTVIRNQGLPHHYAYDLGMPRLSCAFCIFATRDALLIAGHNNRELLDEYVAVEEKTGYGFTQKQTLGEIRDALDAGEAVPTKVTTWEDCGG